MKQIILSFMLLLFSIFAIADTYRVELCVFESNVHSSYFNSINNVKLIVDLNNLYRYYLGDFEDMETAEEAQKMALEKGFKYARIINYTKELLSCTNNCKSPDHLQNIFFDFDQYTLRAASQVELDHLTAYLNSNPSHLVRLSGHTDAKGTEYYNTNLSRNRAMAAKKYLLRKGIEEYRVLVSEFGEKAPIAKNQEESGRQFNRRVVFTILDKEGNEIEGLVAPIDVPELLRMSPFDDAGSFLTMVL